jgi:hypothetical protein
VTQHLEAAGIGGDGATDRRAVTAPEVDAVGPSGRRRRGSLDVGHRRPGARGELPALLIDVGDPREPAQAERRPPRQRNPAHRPGPYSPLRHEGDAGVPAQGHHFCHFGAVAGAHHRSRIAPESTRPVGAIRFHHLGVHHDMLGSHDGPEALHHPRVKRGGRAFSHIEPLRRTFAVGTPS